jgi:hypothetical protein
MLHLKACARTRRQKIADWVLIVFGVVAAVYSTAQTVRVCLWFSLRAVDAWLMQRMSAAHGCARGAGSARWALRDAGELVPI